jgi:prepilin-type N-terminal cleavage/methylation domain-containing protein
MKNRMQKGFTLIELLVVIAITAIILTLLAVPLIQGFRLTRAGQAYAEAQDRARLVMDRISKELGTAAAVLDNSLPSAAVEVKLPLGVYAGGGPAPNSTTDIVEDPAARVGSVYLHHAKIDIIPAAKGDPAARDASGTWFNPYIGRFDPTAKGPIGQVTIPVAPGQTLVRYFIGLRDPRPNRRYVNSWEPIIFGAKTGFENLFVLYRAEVQPWVYDAQLGRYVGNANFFPIDPNGNPIIDDPGFFVSDPYQFYDTLANHQARQQNWANVAEVVTQDLRTDMIVTAVDESTRLAIYEQYPPIPGTYIPRVRPLTTFQALRVNNEPGTGNEVTRPGVEMVDANLRGAPEYYVTEMIGWTKDSLVRFFPENPQLGQPYFLARWRQPSGGTNVFEQFDQELVHYDPVANSDEYNQGDVVFDISGYMRAAEQGNPLIGNFVFGGAPLNALKLYKVDARRGRIIMSFPALHALGVTPSTSTDAVNATYTGWLTSPTGQSADPSGQLARRFFDLRQATGGGGNWFNPLAATGLGYPLDGRIVPGSEIVIGPDQRPGPNFGLPIRYTRVSASATPGINQYKINYTDIAQPDWTILGLPDPNINSDVRTYIEPRYRKGYVEFNSDPSLPLSPNGVISVEFEFQLNDPNDVLTVDYDSGQRIAVELTLRRYPGSAGTDAQSVTVKEVISVRNFIR